MRRVLLCIVSVVSLIAVTGCDFRTMVPPGEGQVRYRDEVFTEVTRTNGITYGSAVRQDGTTMTLQLDLYRPTGDTVTERPLIIFVHGGSFRSGTRTSAEIVDEANTFARKGYVTASISYRLSENGCTSVTLECVNAIQDAREDGQAAVRFFRRYAADYGIDTSRIAMAGTSAGAITAVEVGYGPEEVGTSGNPGYDSKVNSAVSFSGAQILTRPAPGEASVLLLHGTADVVVPYQWAVDTAAAADAAGTHAELTSWEGAGHVPYATYRQQILDETTNFLWWTMNMKHAAVGG
jgi:acetyl esterase/lipase